MASSLPAPVCFLLFFFIPPLLQLPFCGVAQSSSNAGRVAVGASLSTDDTRPWLSPSGDFAFGFRNVTDGAAVFVLAIWYNKIPDRTIVWYANAENNDRTTVPKGSRVDLTSNDGLVLTISSDNQRIIISQLTAGGVVDSGFLNDTGNFIIRNSDSAIAWESFRQPTNTLLPGQILETNGALNSMMTEANYTQGRFQLRLLADGNLVLNTVNLETRFAYDAYFSSHTSSTDNVTNPRYRLVFNTTAYLMVLVKNGETKLLTPVRVNSVADYYHRLTLDFDGVLTQYNYPKNSGGAGDGWKPVWSEPDNICVDLRTGQGSGTCGFNSICRLGEDKRPTCQCPRGFLLMDPNDKYGTCKPNFVQDCDGEGQPGEEYDFLELPNTDWPDTDFEQLRPIKEEDCRKACLSDCMCAVAIFNGDSCWKKKLPLSNGKWDSSYAGTSLIKIRKDNSPPKSPDLPGKFDTPGKKDGRGVLMVVGSVLLGGSMLANFLLILGLCSGFFVVYYKKKLLLNIPPSGGNIPETNIRCFAYQELVDATDNFKEELGRGSFGIVYKGVMRNIGSATGNPVVAVKKLDRMMPEANDKEFKAEVNAIGQTHHRNLVRLVGFCDEESHRLLVYEYLSNGPLASFLVRDPKPVWAQRTQIAVGIARGLLYLHEECSVPIIHCDIKPQNILLDDYFNPRIADFGLAKLLMMNQSRTQTGIRGTKGYVAPEWFRNEPVAAKVDVYSFGVMLLEIVCSCRIWDIEIGGQNGMLVEWAYDCYKAGELETLVGSDKEAMDDWRKLERFVKVGLWCIQEDPSLRPTMRKVTQMLEGVVDVQVPPNPFPAFGSSTV